MSRETRDSSLAAGAPRHLAGLPRPAQLVGTPTRRRAGVFRRALRRETSRIRDPRRFLAMLLLAVMGALLIAGVFLRGEAGGADARAYWAAARLWINGGDPYHPTGPFMPFVYSPWLLPLFLPWAMLPWEVAWFVWRGATVLGLLWSIDWAYRRRPYATTILLLVLAFPIAANIDTGNVTLPLALLLFAAQFSRPVLAGLIWAVATTAKWVPAPALLLLEPRGRLWGIGWLVVAGVLTLATLPLTLVQLQVLFSFPRPPRIDYLVLLWAVIPWLWRHPQPLWWLRPRAWLRVARGSIASASVWRAHWRRSPERTADAARRVVTTRVRAFLGIGV